MTRRPAPARPATLHGGLRTFGGLFVGPTSAKPVGSNPSRAIGTCVGGALLDRTERRLGRLSTICRRVQASANPGSVVDRIGDAPTDLRKPRSDTLTHSEADKVEPRRTVEDLSQICRT